MRKGRHFRRTTVITLSLLAFLGGLGFARLKWQLTDFVVIISFLAFLVTIFRLRFAAVLGVIVFGFVLGWWRGQVFLEVLSPLETLQGTRVIATVRAETDAVYDDRKQLSFDASNLHVLDPVDEVLPGKLLISGFGEPAIYKGDIIKVEGKLNSSRGSRQLRMSFADMEVLGRSSSPIDTLRRRFAAGMETALPEPLGSFGLGLLIGQRSTLPDTVSVALSTVGLTHIIAVSGYNLTIIMRGIRRILKKRSKYQTTVLSLLLMGLFLLMTGFSASIVRAAIVSGLSLWAWYYGRNFRPLLLLMFAATLTAGWNPFYLWSDIGWYLSFLAFFGVMVVAPLLQTRFLKSKEPSPLTAVLIESVCALLMTIPFVLYIFQQISLIALVANLLIVPLVPLAMLFALIAGIAGMVVPVLSGIFAFPANILLTYILDLAQLMSQIPHALVERRISLITMLFLYCCIAIFVYSLWRKVSKTVRITDIEQGQEL